MDKSNQIFYRWKHDINGLKAEAVDILSRTYFEIGQRPTAEDVVAMANTLVDDLSTNPKFSTMTMEDVAAAFKKGVRNGDEASVFLNVRTWNIWLRAEKKIVAKRVIKENQQKQLEYHNNVNQIGSTLSKAKLLGSITNSDDNA